MVRRLIAAALLLLAAAVPALAQSPYPPGPPPAVPGLPDSQRQTTYTISGTTCACSVGFQLYGDSTDYQSWVEVWVNGVNEPYNDPTYGWTITSPTGSLSVIPRPITDAVLTFNNPQTATVIIVGAQRPRRTAQFSENQGVPARALNQWFNTVVAMLREVWDKINDVAGRGLFFPGGTTVATLPSLASCEGLVLGFNLSGLPICQALPQPGTVGPFLLNGAQLNVTGASTLSTSNGGYTINLGGSAFYTFSVSAAGSYSPGFTVLLVNNDSWSGGRAKFINISGGSSFMLWPTQMVLLTAQNGAWQYTLPRVRIPQALTLCTNPASGSDTLGVADGLGSGAGCFASFQSTALYALADFDFAPLGTNAAQARLTILMQSCSCADTAQIHLSPQGSMVGAQGGAALLFDGNDQQLNISGADCVQTYFAAVVQFRRLTFNCGGNAITADWGSHVFMEDGITLGVVTGADFLVRKAATIELDDSLTIAGAYVYFVQNLGGYFDAPSPITVTYSTGFPATAVVFAPYPGTTNLGGITWSGGTGWGPGATNKYSIGSCAIVVGTASIYVQGGSGAGVTTSCGPQ